MKRINSSSSNRRRRSAFTLLELLIVLGIIVALAAMVAPNLIGSAQDANIQVTRATIKNIEDAFKRKAIKNAGDYGDVNGSQSIRDLASPWTDNLQQEQKPLLEEIPRDAWNKEFQCSFDSATDTKPQIWSFGPNKIDDGGEGDDITNKRREIDE